ncbi:hypothetical protein ACWD04_02625 [Streptomyces sp. NPDC002911]
MSVRRPVVVGWALLVAGGWAATLWLGEPSATAGPGPAPAAGVPADNPEPGPQPEGSCETRGAPPTASPSASATQIPEKGAYDYYTEEHAHQVVCFNAVVRDGAVAR